MDIGEESEAIEVPIPVCPGEAPPPDPVPAEPEPAEPEKVPA